MKTITNRITNIIDSKFKDKLKASVSNSFHSDIMKAGFIEIWLKLLFQVDEQTSDQIKFNMKYGRYQ